MSHFVPVTTPPVAAGMFRNGSSALKRIQTDTIQSALNAASADMGSARSGSGTDGDSDSADDSSHAPAPTAVAVAPAAGKAPCHALVH